MSKENLVIGGGGALGQALVKSLIERDEPVVIIDSNNADVIKKYPDTKKIKFIQKDFLDLDIDKEGIGEVSRVFQCAGIADHSFSENYPQIYWDQNFRITLKALHLVREYHVSKYIHPSSAAVYGRLRGAMREDMTREPVNAYGLCKKMEEDLIEFWGDKFGVNSIIFRIFNAYHLSASPHGVIGHFIRNSRQGKKNIVHQGHKRDFIHIQDVAEAMLIASEVDNDQTVFNLGYGKSTSIETVAKMIGKYELINNHDLPATDGWADMAKFTQYYDWRPSISIEEGLSGFL